MLVNLPKNAVCGIVGKELMRYFAVKDQTSGEISVLIYMSDIQQDNASMAVKYYPIVGEKPKFLKYFKDVEGQDTMCIPKEIVGKIYNKDPNLTNGEIIEYCKLITEMSEFTKNNPCSIGNYTLPIKVIEQDGDGDLVVTKDSSNIKDMMKPVKVEDTLES
jgi:hypothetical protein